MQDLFCAELEPNYDGRIDFAQIVFSSIPQKSANHVLSPLLPRQGISILRK